MTLYDGQGRPVSEPATINPQQVLEMFQVMQLRTDTMSNQLFIVGVTLDFLIKKLNSFALKNDVANEIIAETTEQLENAIRPLALLDEEFQPFFKEKYDELLAQLEAQKE